MKTIDLLELTFLNSLEDKTEAQQQRIAELQTIINECTDYFVREALRRRYDNGNYKYIEPWFVIALDLNTTEDQLRKACERYLNKYE